MSKEFSYWEYASYLKGIDVLIIGGGIVGMSAALHLKRKSPKARVVVVERDPFSAGASTKNAGFACFGSPTELLDDLETMSEGEVLGLVERRFRGLSYLRQLLGENEIDYQASGGVELFAPNDNDSWSNTVEKLDYLNRILFEITKSETYKVLSEIPAWKGKIRFTKGIVNVLEGAIDTGKMHRRFSDLLRSESVEFFHGMNVKSIEEVSDGVEVNWGNGYSKVSQVFVCTNAFAKQLVPSLDVRPARNQVIVTAPVEGIPDQGTFHYDKGYVYFRPIHGRILLGGFRHMDRLTESTDEFGLTDTIQHMLEAFLYEYLAPETTPIEYRWSGILGLGPDKTTIVKSVSPRIHVGVRMGGMGVAIGSEIGRELSKLWIC